MRDLSSAALTSTEFNVVAGAGSGPASTVAGDVAASMSAASFANAELGHVLCNQMLMTRASRVLFFTCGSLESCGCKRVTGVRELQM